MTGDKEIDALLWLRQVIETGDPVRIAQAKEAAGRITTPPGELEQRYGKWLVAKAGHMLAGLGSIGFANLDGLAERSIERRANESEAIGRFGDALWDDTQAEAFCQEVLRGLEQDSWQLPPEQVAERFKAVPELMPHTLSDCLAELAFWDGLYHLRSAWQNSGDDIPQVSARRDYLRHCLSVLRCKGKDEAKAVLRYLVDQDMRDDADPILENLIG